MRHLKDYRKLGRTTAHRKAMIRNMVTSLIAHERIETTLPKAKELRRFAEHMITIGKQGSLHARRQALSFVRNSQVVQKLFAELAVRFQDRAGGYTRIYRLGDRPGDNAPMAMIEYLGAPLKAPKQSKQKASETEPKTGKKPKRSAKVEKAESKEAKKKVEKKVAKKSEAPKKEAAQGSKKQAPITKPKTGLLQKIRRRKKED